MNGGIRHNVKVDRTCKRVIASRYPSLTGRFRKTEKLSFPRSAVEMHTFPFLASTECIERPGNLLLLTVARRTLSATLTIVFLVLSSSAFAHHILGIPHYAYDEDYPQTPVLTYTAELGSLEMKLTGYPGNPKPGEACSLHVYIRRLDGGAPFHEPVTLSIMRDRLIGDDPVVYGPITAHLEESIYKFYPRFEEEANYIVRVEYEHEGVPWIIDLPMVVGEPGSPWAVAGVVAAALAAFLVLIRALRIKMKRQVETSVKTAAKEAHKSLA